MSATTIPAGYRLADGWYECEHDGYFCLHMGCDPAALPTAKWRKRNDWACAAHALERGAFVPAEAPAKAPISERCSCEESLALRAQLREAAAHVGELLALLADSGPGTGAGEKRNAARTWLTAYLAKGGA